MSGKVANHFYCVSCDVKFDHEANFNSHCKGKKHKTNERLKNEQDAAAASIVVKGAKGPGCKNLEQFLASCFCKFGLLAKVSSLGPTSHGIGKVQFAQPDSVEKVLKAGTIHKHRGLALRVSKFEYKPQWGDAIRIAAKEEGKKQESARESLHSNIVEILDHESSLQRQLEALTESLQLTWEDLVDRSGIVTKIREVFTPSHPEVNVYQFGSSINGYGMRGCDLDLFLHLDLDKPVSNKQMRNLHKLLSVKALEATFSDVLCVPSIRCPILKFTHKPTGIKCDLSINNQKALYNTRLLRLYATDPRVQHLVFALRLWAKFRGLSGGAGASAPTMLSSYALTLLVLFYLMRCQPEPVLPAVCDLKAGVPGVSEETVEECSCLIIPEDAQLPEPKNSQTSVELLQGFFNFYKEEIDFARDALLTRDAKISPRATLTNYLNCRIGAMTVVDPFNLSHNVAGNVNEDFRNRFIEEIKRASELSSQWSQSSRMQELFELVQPQEQKKPDKKKGSKGESQANHEPETGKRLRTRTRSRNKTPNRMEGEQEDGEFHIILSMSRATQTSGGLMELDSESRLAAEQGWVEKARDLTLTVLKTIFLAELEEQNCRESGKGIENAVRASEPGDGVKVELDESLTGIRERSCDESLRIVEKSGGSYDDGLQNSEEMKMEVEEDLFGANGHGKKRCCESARVDDKRSDEHYLGLSEHSEMSCPDGLEEMPKKRLCFASTSGTSSHRSSTSSLSSVPDVATSVSSGISCVTTTVTVSGTTASTSSMTTSTVCSPSAAKVCSPGAAIVCEKVQPTRGQAAGIQVSSNQTTLRCTCPHPVWHGRKKLKQELMQVAHPATCSGCGFTLEREITLLYLKQQATLVASQNAATTTTHAGPAVLPATSSSLPAGHVDMTRKICDLSAPLNHSADTHDKVRKSDPASRQNVSVEGTSEKQQAVEDADVAQNPLSSLSSGMEDSNVGHNPVATSEHLVEPRNLEAAPGTTQVCLNVKSTAERAALDEEKRPTHQSRQEDSQFVGTETGSNGPAASQDSHSESASNQSGENFNCSKSRSEGNQNDVCQISNDMNSGISASTSPCDSFSEKSDSMSSTKKVDSQNSVPAANTDKGANSNDNQNDPDKFCLEFSCDLILNGGHSRQVEEGSDPPPPPHLLIKLRPAKDSVKHFKVFYDVFRSVMLRLNASELNK